MPTGIEVTIPVTDTHQRHQQATTAGCRRSKIRRVDAHDRYSRCDARKRYQLTISARHPVRMPPFRKNSRIETMRRWPRGRPNRREDAWIWCAAKPAADQPGNSGAEQDDQLAQQDQ